MCGGSRSLPLECHQVAEPQFSSPMPGERVGATSASWVRIPPHPSATPEVSALGRGFVLRHPVCIRGVYSLPLTAHSYGPPLLERLPHGVFVRVHVARQDRLRTLPPAEGAQILERD